jgi:hypothetical protein
MVLKFDFRCKACKKWKTEECTHPEEARATYGCKDHTVFSTYEQSLEKVGKYIKSLGGKLG